MSQDFQSKLVELLTGIDLTLREIAKDQRVTARILEAKSKGIGDPFYSNEEPYPADSSLVSWATSQVPEWARENRFAVSRVIARFEGLGALDCDGYARCYEQFVMACRGLDVDPLRLAIFKDLLNLLADGKSFLVLTEHDLHRAVIELGSQKISPSVDGARQGAVGGTSESTEGDHNKEEEIA